MSPSFSAAEQNLGYLFQARMALLQVLEGEEDAALVLEGLDDITITSSGDPRALIQLKHHGKEASLTDSSPDLWKTIRVWSTHYKQGKFSVPGTRLTLITTARSSDDSIAYMLGPGKDRDPNQAAERLITVASTSQNQDLTPAFSAFLSLSRQEQVALVSSITIIDSHPNISDTSIRIKELLRTATRKEHREPLFERLEGWWFGRVISNLHNRDGEVTPIHAPQVFLKIAEFAEMFRPDALPIDFLSATPDQVPDPAGDNRQFVVQLRAISLQHRRIEKAIVDYYRAFEQRSRWVREELLLDDELERYEDKLVDEWERYCLALSEEADYSKMPEDDCQRFGREVYRWMEQNADIKIRSNVNEEYIMRGSYHILADRVDPRIYWHPRFIDRLKELLKAPSYAAAVDSKAN